MTVPTVPAPADPNQITSKDVWLELFKMRVELGPTIQNASAVPDHESRIRGLERWRYALPINMIMAVGSAAVAIYGILRK